MKVTDYTGIAEYEKFLQERMEIKNRELDFSNVSDEKLLDLKDQFTPDSIWNPDARYNLRKFYDEITRRKL